MILKLKKHEREAISEHFSQSELDCKCKREDCLWTYIDTDLIDGLEELRQKTGPLIVTSAYRCSSHNDAIEGKPGSMHLLGKAADVRSQIISADKIASYAEKILLFTNGGIGYGKTFTHIDVRGYRARWLY